MSNSIENHQFYRNFTPFINAKTKTAEKTMNGRVYSSYTPPYKLSKELYNYLSAGGLLILPVLALTISKKNIFSGLKKTNKEFFSLINSNSSGFWNNISKKIAILKYNCLTKFWSVVKPLRSVREKWSIKLNATENQSLVANSYRYINSLLKGTKTNAANKIYFKAQKSFMAMEDNLEPILKIIDASAKGKVRVVFPKSLLKNSPDEIPMIVKLNKTAKGKNRVKEIRKILDEIKKMLDTKNVNFDDILKKITFSCEDIFAKGEATLISMHKTLRAQGMSSSKTDRIIKSIYDNFNKYRFAEVASNSPNLSPEAVRKLYLHRIKKDIELLKPVIKNNTILKTHVDTLEDLILKRASSNNMGLLEKLRFLLKCNDVPNNVLKTGVKPSFLKQYKPDEYLRMKKLINDFARNIKSARMVQTELLPAAMQEIDRGSAFTQAIALAAPTALLGTNIYCSRAGESKEKNKRNFYSFLVGSLVMLGGFYVSMQQKSKLVVEGILAAFLTSRLYERYFQKQ